MEPYLSEIFRILSPTAILGYGFPERSFEQAMQEHIDLIAVDAGSVDAGPYYLGSSKHYVAMAALERDLRFMIRGSIQQQCPCIIGSAGFSGANPQCHAVLELIQRITIEEGGNELNIAHIDATVPSELIRNYQSELTALGRMPVLSDDILTESKIVGQMGIEPIITALEQGADIIVCGRAYDPAVFAAAPIHAGFDPGICYHAGKILECGAIACTPGSGSDCLIAEIHRDRHAEFYPCNDMRACTIKSIAAHSLYEKSRPDFFHLPGGILSIQKTEFYHVNDKRAGIRGSQFIAETPSIKLEGSQAVGERSISLVSLNDCNDISDDIRIYGRNGVEADHDDTDMGIICLVQSDNKTAAHDVLANLRSGLLHYGYPGRISTAGNLAFPCSPSDIDCVIDETPSSLFIAGTRDPIFQREWSQTQIALLQQVQSQIPDLFEQCDIKWIIADANNPVAFIQDQSQLSSLNNKRKANGFHLESLSIGTVYQWSVHHLIKEQACLEQLFPISLWKHDQTWQCTQTIPCNWHHSPSDSTGTIGADQALLIQDKTQEHGIALIDAAEVIRSKNAGINEITFDIIFKNEDNFKLALASSAFENSSITSLLGIPDSALIGCYQYPIVNAIKITCHRSCLAGSPQDRDVFGAQQQSKLLRLLF